MENFQVLKLTEKIGVLSKGEWLVMSSYEYKNETYLRMSLNKHELRVIGIIELRLIEDGIKKGVVELKGIRKVKKHKNDK